MPAVSAVSPNLQLPEMGPRRFDMVDSLLILKDEGAAIAASTAGAGIEFKGEANCYYKVVVQHRSYTGYAAGTNFWTLNVEVSDDNTNWTTVRSIVTTDAEERYDVALEGAEVAAIMDAAGEGEAIWIRANATLTGAAGALEYTAHVTA